MEPTTGAGGVAGLRAAVLEQVRVLAIAGIATGVVLGGVLSRLAMGLLRITSPDDVRGVTSDDGFTIGEVTVGGSYALLALGAVVGVIGAVAYQLVAPWLVGPRWFRWVTVAAASGAVVGSMLVHADGVDFTFLEPTWLAVGLFVALPALFGLVIGPVVEAVSRPSSWTRRGRRVWALPLALVAPFPVALVVLVPAGVVFAVWVLAKGRLGRGLPGPVLTTAVRGLWLAVALAGAVALVRDVRAVYA